MGTASVTIWCINQKAMLLSKPELKPKLLNFKWLLVVDLGQDKASCIIPGIYSYSNYTI